jgi:hypothetical protein
MPLCSAVVVLGWLMRQWDAQRFRLLDSLRLSALSSFSPDYSSFFVP